MTSINQIINNDIIIIIITAIIVSIAIIKVLEAVEELISSIRELFFGKKQKVRQAIALKTNSFFTPPTAIQQQPTLVDQPIMVVEQPAVIVAQPTMVLEQPAVIVAQPTMVLEQPAVIVDQPTMVLAQPAVIVDQPTMVLAQPATIDEQPTTIVPLLSKAPLGVIFKKEETTINSKKNESEYGALSSQKANELFAKTYGGLSVSKTNTKLSFAEDLIQYVNVDYNCTWIAGERDAIQGNWNRVLAHADHSMNAMHHEEAKALCQGDRMRASSLTDDERDELRVEIAEFESNFKPVAQCTKPEVDPNQVDDLYPVRPNQAGTRDWSHSRAWTPSARPKPVVFPTLPPVTVAAPVVQVSDTTSTTATNDNDSMDVDMEDVFDLHTTNTTTNNSNINNSNNNNNNNKGATRPTVAPRVEVPTGTWKTKANTKKFVAKLDKILEDPIEPLNRATATRPKTTPKLYVPEDTWMMYSTMKFRSTMETVLEEPIEPLNRATATRPKTTPKLYVPEDTWMIYSTMKFQPVIDTIEEEDEPTILLNAIQDDEVEEEFADVIGDDDQDEPNVSMEEAQRPKARQRKLPAPRIVPRRSARLQANQQDDNGGGDNIRSSRRKNAAKPVGFYNIARLSRPRRQQ